MRQAVRVDHQVTNPTGRDFKITSLSARRTSLVECVLNAEIVGGALEEE
jgi:hypothetical protein